MGSPVNNFNPLPPPTEFSDATVVDDSQNMGMSTMFQSQGQAGANGAFIVQRGTPDRVEFGPAFQIGPRDIVQVSPLPTNFNVVQVATSGGPDMARIGPAFFVIQNPNAVNPPSIVPRIVRVRNLNEIGMYTGVIGEGILIEVQQYQGA